MIKETKIEHESLIPKDLPEDNFQKLQILMQSRQKLEKEMDSIYNYLTVENKFGLEGGLIDREGFPINDVDKILAVRTARHKMASKTIKNFQVPFNPFFVLQ